MSSPTSSGWTSCDVDLSAIVDKYIGETEKNLERSSTRPRALNVVLFFDEADALFGSRSEVKDAHDRYANQEVAYLLQRMEQFDGITILATNLRGNLDPAFSRRLSFIVHFPDPDVATRRRLWQQHLAGCRTAIRTIRSTSTSWRRPSNWPAATSATSCWRPAYDARSRASRPGMRHVVAATVGEYPKLGRRVPVRRIRGSAPRDVPTRRPGVR